MMHSVRKIPIASVVAVALAFLVTAASAHDGSKVAFIDLQYIIRQSSAGQSITSQVRQLRKAASEEIAEMEDELRKRETDIAAKSSLLSEDKLTTLRVEFERDLQELRDHIRNQESHLGTRETEAIGELQGHVLRILQDIMTEREIDIILGRPQYLVANKTLDLTEDVISELNSSVPAMTLKDTEQE